MTLIGSHKRNWMRVKEVVERPLRFIDGGKKRVARICKAHCSPIIIKFNDNMVAFSRKSGRICEQSWRVHGKVPISIPTSPNVGKLPTADKPEWLISIQNRGLA